MIDTKLPYVKEWLVEQRVLCYRFCDLKSATVKQWVNDLTAELVEWPPERSWLLLLDVRLGGSIVNTYALSQGRMIARLRPELPGRLAILVGSKLASDIISMAVRSVGNQYRQRDVFVSEGMAIRWLLEEDNRLNR